MRNDCSVRPITFMSTTLHCAFTGSGTVLRLGKHSLFGAVGPGAGIQGNTRRLSVGAGDCVRDVALSFDCHFNNCGGGRIGRISASQFKG